MRRIRQIGHRGNGLVSGSLAIALVVGLGFASVAQDGRPPVVTSTPASVEAAAPPDTKKAIEAARVQSTALGSKFSVGFTSASTRRISQLAGTIPPPPATLVQLARAHNQEAQKRLDAVTAQADHPLTQALVRSALAQAKDDPGSPDPAAPAFDWSKRGVVGSVKDQSLCGDCWNFAAIGVFESMYAIRYGKDNLLDLSEEQVLRSNKEGGSCCGGWWAFNTMRDDGVVGEERLPYDSARGGSSDIQCLVPPGNLLSRAEPALPSPLAGRRYKIAAWKYVTDQSSIPTPDQIKQSLCEHGPVIAAVWVSDAFQHYTGGLFNEKNPGGPGQPINHAVMIVGWNEVGWIVRNSWGPNWGANGYINIAFDSNQIGYGAAWVEPYRD